MTRVFLSTANVGSVFENIEEGLERWIDEFLKVVNENNPEFIAVHFQETGGKNYQNCLNEIDIFFKEVRKRFADDGYVQVEGFVDSQSEIEDQYTALSSLYFVHEDLNETDVQIWNFKEKTFSSISKSKDSPIHIGVDLTKTERKQKEKFPQDFFPDFKWSRKGFLRTRWRIKQEVLDLVNIHLFHDSCNFIASSTFPSPFANNRLKTLNYTLDKLLQDDGLTNCPLFIFGDFNFRLNTYKVFDILQRDLDKLDSGDDNTLVIDSKVFSCPQHENRFKTDFDWLRPFEFEAKQFPLNELALDFHPSYPFSEDHDENFAKTRCPAWCDRVLFTDHAKSKIDFNESQPVYQLVGSSICMGDHKPVFFAFKLHTTEEGGLSGFHEKVDGASSSITEQEDKVEEDDVKGDVD